MNAVPRERPLVARRATRSRRARRARPAARSLPVVVLVLEVAVVEDELVVADHGHAPRTRSTSPRNVSTSSSCDHGPDQHAVRDAVADRRRTSAGASPSTGRTSRPAGRSAPSPCSGRWLELVPVLVVLLVLPPEAPVVDLAADRHLVELDQRQVAEDAVVQHEVGRARAGDQADRARPERRRRRA